MSHRIIDEVKEVTLHVLQGKFLIKVSKKLFVEINKKKA